MHISRKNDLENPLLFSQLRTFFIPRIKPSNLARAVVANGKMGKKVSSTLIKYVHIIGTDNERNVINKLFCERENK